MNENGSLDTMDGSGVIDCLSIADVSRPHKQDLRNLRGVQDDVRIYSDIRGLAQGLRVT